MAKVILHLQDDKQANAIAIAFEDTKIIDEINKIISKMGVELINEDDVRVEFDESSYSLDHDVYL